MKDAPNKMIGNAEQREYHFAGVGEHAPFSVIAGSTEEAIQKRNERLGIVTVKSEYVPDAVQGASGEESALD